MKDQTSIPCTTDARDTLAEMKPDDTSWSEFLCGIAEDGEVRGTEAVGDLSDQLETIDSALTALEERTGRIERALDGLGAGR